MAGTTATTRAMTTVRAMTAPSATGPAGAARRAPRTTRQHAGFTGAVDAWLRSLEVLEGDLAAAEPGPPAGDPSDSRPLLIFGRAPDCVVLSTHADRPSHPGTARFAPPREEMPVLSEIQRRALALAIGALGHPYDAVNPQTPAQGSIGWGLTGLRGSTLVQALTRWRASEPQAFAALLRTAGIDLAGAGDEGPVLAFTGARATLVGEPAEQAIFRDPAAVAALVRAGRRPEAQLAQRETVAQRFSVEALGAAALGGAPLGGILVDLPALLLLALSWVALGESGPLRIASLLEPGEPADAVALSLALAERLCQERQRPTAERLLRHAFYLSSLETPALDTAFGSEDAAEGERAP